MEREMDQKSYNLIFKGKYRGILVGQILKLSKADGADWGVQRVN